MDLREKEKALNRGHQLQIPDAYSSHGNLDAESGSGYSSNDTRPTQTIQSKLLEVISKLFDSIGERTARSMGWTCSFTAEEIAEWTGISNRQASNAMFRLKNRRHMIWYDIPPGGTIYKVRIPENWYWRESHEQ